MSPATKEIVKIGSVVPEILIFQKKLKILKIGTPRDPQPKKIFSKNYLSEGGSFKIEFMNLAPAVPEKLIFQKNSKFWKLGSPRDPPTKKFIF